MQNTLKSPVVFDGVGLHSGKPVRATVHPAPADCGIVFHRLDVLGVDSRIPALWDHVQQSPLCTRLVNADGVSISTVEHIMAALAGCGIHNAVIEVTGAEVPILDGSSHAFVRKFLATGFAPQKAPVRALRVVRPIETRKGDAWARLSPAETLIIDFHIAFADPAIGVQTKRLNMANGSFVRELSDSRTFCCKSDVDAMRANGLALGGTLENAVVVDGARVLSPGGLRHADEAVRHKMLDALGDLALAGMPILGHYEGHRAGHAITNDLLRVMFDTPDAVEIVTCDAATLSRLPGAGVHAGELPDVA